MADTVRLIGEGGVEWEFDLPLSEVFANQVASRALRPADDDSAAVLEEHGYLGEAAADAADVPDVKPLSKMKLAELLDHAAAVGVDADTLAELEKPGTAKAAVIAAIDAKTEQ